MAQRRPKTATCEFCDDIFAYRRNKRFCSSRCRYKAWQAGNSNPLQAQINDLRGRVKDLEDGKLS